jgi:hypothetical protein
MRPEPQIQINTTKTPKVSQIFQTLLERHEIKGLPKKHYEYFAVSDTPNIKRIQFRVPNLLENKIKRLGGQRIIHAPFSKKIPCTEPDIYRNQVADIQWRHSYPKLLEKQKEQKTPKIERQIKETLAEPKPRGRNRGNSFVVPSRVTDQANLEEEWSKLRALHKQEKARRKGHKNITSTYKLYRTAHKKESSFGTSQEVIFEASEELEKVPAVESKIKRKMSRFHHNVIDNQLHVHEHNQHQYLRRQSRQTPLSNTHTFIPPISSPTIHHSLIVPEDTDSNANSETESHLPRKSYEKRSVTGQSSGREPDRGKKKKAKRRGFGIVLDQRMEHTLEQREEIERIIKVFERHGLNCDKGTLEKGLLDPVDLKRDLILLPKQNPADRILSDDDHVSERRQRPSKERKNTIKHSDSTKVSCC